MGNYGGRQRVCSLTKELRQSSETWHVLKSNFFDTDCNVFLQVNLHWINNFALK